LKSEKADNKKKSATIEKLKAEIVKLEKQLTKFKVSIPLLFLPLIYFI